MKRKKEFIDNTNNKKNMRKKKIEHNIKHTIKLWNNLKKKRQLTKDYFTVRTYQQNK